MSFDPLSPRSTPGAYMKRCRQRAGLSIEQCAEKITLGDHNWRQAVRDLTALEAEQPGDYYRLARQLNEREVFDFDIGTFAVLASSTSDVSLEDWAA